MSFENGTIARASFVATHTSGRVQVNTLHYDIDMGVTAFDWLPGADSLGDVLQNLADVLRDDVLGPFKAMYDSGWSVSPVTILEERDPQNLTRARIERSSGAAAGGTNPGVPGGDAMPNATCAVATLRSDHVGRRATGRMFLGGSLFEGHQAGGTWNDTPRAWWNAFLAAIPKQPDVSGAIGVPDFTPVANWVVYSRTNRLANASPYTSKVQSTILRTPVHWLRSREH